MGKTLGQHKKFNRYPVSAATRLLLCWTLSLVPQTTLVADVALDTPPQAAPVEDRLQPLKSRLEQQYSDVNHLSIEDYLAQHPNAVLIDVRAAEEYAVSRIPGAINIADHAELLAYAQNHSGSLILLYCSVGVRSSEAARYLNAASQAKGSPPRREIGEVANLAGSIFEWANENRPLENDAGVTNEVHPYNAWWGWRYLDR